MPYFPYPVYQELAIQSGGRWAFPQGYPVVTAAAVVGGRGTRGALCRRALGHETLVLAGRQAGGLVPHQGAQRRHVNVLEIDALDVVVESVVFGVAVVGDEETREVM